MRNHGEQNRQKLISMSLLLLLESVVVLDVVDV